MNNYFKNKKILLAVCGSISFYKAFSILSDLKKECFDVYVMLSDGALNFINHKGFEALCDHPILTSKTEDWQKGVNHIEYSKMDIVLIAPASVNTINKFANGICDNVFMQTLIATKAPIIIAPAANNRMLENKATINSLNFLQNNGATIIEPIEKILACKEVGKGGLAETKKIIYNVKKAILKDDFFLNKNVVITGGSTTEKIDDVRAIINFSSGKMSKALADAFYYLGANVTLITSEKEIAPYKIVNFKSTYELVQKIEDSKLDEQSILIMAAAISDYIMENKFNGKMKKDDFGKSLSLNLKENINILSLLKNKKTKKIAFKLETDKENSIKNAQKLLDEKNLDAVCLNVLDENVKFGSDKTQITFIDKKEYKNLELAPKFDIAMMISKLIKSL